MRKMFAAPIAVFGLLIGACGGDDDSPPPERVCGTTGCLRPGGGGSALLVIENRTGASVDIGVAERRDVRIDRRVVNGTLSLPIPVVTTSDERRLSIESGQTTSINGDVAIIDGENVTRRFGAFVRVADGPLFLTVGVGKVFVRTSDDGSPFIEAEDPKVVRIMPTTVAVPECTAGELTAPFPPPPLSFYDAMRKKSGAQRVRSVVRAADGCRDIAIENDDGDAVATLHVCIPDEAYPFAEGVEVRVSAGADPATATASSSSAGDEASSGSMEAPSSAMLPTTSLTTTMRFVDERGAELILTRLVFAGRTSTQAEGLTLAFDPDDACAHVDETCRHVDVPARITARIGDGAATRVVYGQPMVDTAQPRTFYVLAGSARPIAATACTGDEDPGAMAPGRAWVATVIR